MLLRSRWRWRAWRGLRVGLGWMTLSSAVWSAPPAAAPAPAATSATPLPGALRLTVSDAVLGILAHTRWPQGQGRTRPLSLCVSESSLGAEELRALHESVPPGRLAPVRLLDADDDAAPGCDAVYLGGGPLAAELLARLVGRPVLSIGEGAEFCSRGGMFCLVPRQGTLRVEVNLDAVARSGLHVHPQVLKIGQPRPETPP